MKNQNVLSMFRKWLQDEDNITFLYVLELLDEIKIIKRNIDKEGIFDDIQFIIRGNLFNL